MKADREDRKDKHIEPIGKAESFGESADTDLLKPGRWKRQADNRPWPVREETGTSRPEKFKWE